MKLPKSAESVQIALEQKGLACKVVELNASTRTAADAASAIGCQVAEIIKSLLFCTKGSKIPVLVLASGINRVSEQVIEKLIGDTIVKADADFTRNVTGFAIGGIPPLGHKQPITHIFIDEDLLQYRTLWAAAGTPNTVFSLSVTELERATGGKVVTIKGSV